MDDLLKKYSDKFIHAGLAMDDGPNTPLIGGWDRSLTWNRPGPEIPVLTQVFQQLNINSLAFLRPCPPYDRIIGFLADRALMASGRITPQDCETRTFLHDLPVVDRFDARAVGQALSLRKTVIIQARDPGGNAAGPAVIAPGTITPEQGFVHISSVCFACFVKFFSDYLWILKTGQTDPEMDAVFDHIRPFLTDTNSGGTSPASFLMPGPFISEAQVIAGMSQAGKLLVTDRLWIPFSAISPVA